LASYEAMFVFKPQLQEEQQKGLADELEKLLKDNQSQIESYEPFGRHVLAYEIDKCKEGNYFLMHFSSESSKAVSKLNRACSINENILRSIVIKKKVKKIK